MAGKGGQTKQVTLDVLNTDSGLQLGIILAGDRYTFSKFFFLLQAFFCFGKDVPFCGGIFWFWSDLLFLVDHLVCLNFVAISLLWVRPLDEEGITKSETALRFFPVLSKSPQPKRMNRIQLTRSPLSPVHCDTGKFSEITLCTETSFVVLRICCLIQNHEFITTLQPTTACYCMDSVNNRAYP
jgi:hypothetical protein